MAVNLPAPLVVPEKTFDEVWLSRLQVVANPNEPTFMLSAILAPSRDVKGVKDLDRNSVKVVNRKIEWASLTPAQLQVVMQLVGVVTEIAYAS
jgi:hypothetical protein